MVGLCLVYDIIIKYLIIVLQIEQSVNSHSDSIGVVYILDPSETIKTNCKYSSYVVSKIYFFTIVYKSTYTLYIMIS